MIFGAVAGFIAHAVDTQDVKGGLSSTMLIGILGALVGGAASTMLFGDYLFKFDLVNFTLAISFTILALLIQRSIFIKHTSS